MVHGRVESLKYLSKFKAGYPVDASERPLTSFLPDLGFGARRIFSSHRVSVLYVRVLFPRRPTTVGEDPGSFMLIHSHDS